MKRFVGRIALISGAGSGIGRAVSIRLASEGARLFCVDLQKEAVDQTIALVNNCGGVAQAYYCDVSQENDVRECIRQCIKTYGILHHLINMAGILKFDHFHEIKLENFKHIIDVNLIGTFLMCREAIPYLLNCGGNIVNASSISALAGLPWGGAYSASKGAVLAMTRTIAVEYGRMGLRANCVSPGDIKTPMTASPCFPPDVDLHWMDRCSSLIGAQQPEVVAGVVAMLASDDGIHINGEDIRIDGGALS